MDSNYQINHNLLSKYIYDDYPSCAQPRLDQGRTQTIEDSLTDTLLPDSLDTPAAASYLHTPPRIVSNKAVVTSNITLCGPTTARIQNSNANTKPNTSINDKALHTPANIILQPGANPHSPFSSHSDGNNWHLKPSPISIAYNDSFDFNTLNSTLKEMLGDTYFTKSNKHGTNIMCHNANSYAKLRRYLQDNQNRIVSHTYQNKNDRGFRGVIRHLNKTTPCNWIREKLAALGFKARYLNVIKSRTSNEPLNLFEIELEKCDEATVDAFLQLKILGNQLITVEKLLRKDVPQCHRCQNFGHTKNYCLRLFACVKCAGNHPSAECKKLKNAKPKCANCLGEHTANYKGCTTYKEALHYKRLNSHATIAKTTTFSHPDTKPTKPAANYTSIKANNNQVKQLADISRTISTGIKPSSTSTPIRCKYSSFNSNNLSYAEVVARKNVNCHPQPTLSRSPILRKERQTTSSQQQHHILAPSLLRQALNNRIKHKVPYRDAPASSPQTLGLNSQLDFHSTLSSKLQKLMSILADSHREQHQLLLESTATVKTSITQVSLLITTTINALETFHQHINNNKSKNKNKNDQTPKHQ